MSRAIKDIIADSVKYFPSKFVPIFINFVSLPILTRLLQPAQYGYYALIMAQITLFTNIAAGWINNSIIRFYPDYNHKGKLKVLTTTTFYSLLISIIITSTFSLIILLILKFWSNLDKQLFLLFNIGICIASLNCIYIYILSFLRVTRKAGIYSSCELFNNIFRVLLGVSLIILLHISVSGLFLGWLVSLSILIVILLGCKIVKINIDFHHFHLDVFIDTLKYGYPAVITLLLNSILFLGDRFFIEFLRNSTEVGLYSVSYTIANTSIMSISSLLMFSSYPILFKIWEEKGKQQTALILSELVRYFFMLCLPILVGVSILRKEILIVMADSKYLEANKVIPMVLIGVFCYGLSQYMTIIFHFIKKTYLHAGIAFISVILNIVLNLIFIPKYGYWGAGLSTAVSYLFYLYLSFILSKKYLCLNIPALSIIKISMSSLLIGILLLLTKHYLNISWIGIICSVLISIVSYITLLWYLNEFGKKGSFITIFGTKKIIGFFK